MGPSKVIPMRVYFSYMGAPVHPWGLSPSTCIQPSDNPWSCLRLAPASKLLWPSTVARCCSFPLSTFTSPRRLSFDNYSSNELSILDKHAQYLSPLPLPAAYSRRVVKRRNRRGERLETAIRGQP